MKFMAAFAALGLILSVSFGFVGGNRIFPLIMTAVVCTALSGGLGAGTYKVLEQRVPEFFDLFRGPQGFEEGTDIELGDDGEDHDDEMSADRSGDDDDGGVQSDAKQFGDHIIVDKIKIKNEPKLIAEAIRTMLAKDDS